MKKVALCLWIMFALILGGCEDAAPDALEDDRLQLTLEENKALQKEIDELKKSNAVLNEKLSMTQSQSPVTLDQLRFEDLMEIYKKFPWMHTNQVEMTLNKVTIGRAENDPEAIEITDPGILQAIPHLLLVQHRYFGGFPSGYLSAVGEHVYTLHTETNEYQFRVVGRGIVVVEDELLKVSDEIHQLAAAFVKTEEDYGAHVFTKIKNSGLMIGQEQHAYANFSEFRIKGVASVLISKGKLLQQKPADLSERLEGFIFYYQGEEIIMHLYQDHIHLIEGEKQYWYEAENGGQDILSFLSAG